MIPKNLLQILLKTCTSLILAHSSRSILASLSIYTDPITPFASLIWIKALRTLFTFSPNVATSFHFLSAFLCMYHLTTRRRLTSCGHKCSHFSTFITTLYCLQDHFIPKPEVVVYYCAKWNVWVVFTDGFIYSDTSKKFELLKSLNYPLL